MAVDRTPVDEDRTVSDTRTVAGHAALCVGDPAAPPLLFLHGFPDHPPTAAPFLAALAATGRRVVAPWLRGYAPSPLAGPYDLATLADDALALCAALGPGPVELVGHDWGAAITYAVCARAPERVRRAVAMSVPHPATFLDGLRDPAQLARSAYMALFQIPGAGALAAAADFAFIDRLWARWSPGYRLPAAERRALHACLAASWPAPLGYYRAALRPVGGLRTRLSAARAVVAAPLLQLHGADDGCIAPVARDDDARFAAPRVREVLPGLGHFLHVEAPARVAARVAAYLSTGA